MLPYLASQQWQTPWGVPAGAATFPVHMPCDYARYLAAAAGPAPAVVPDAFAPHPQDIMAAMSSQAFQLSSMQHFAAFMAGEQAMASMLAGGPAAWLPPPQYPPQAVSPFAAAARMEQPCSSPAAASADASAAAAAPEHLLAAGRQSLTGTEVEQLKHVSLDLWPSNSANSPACPAREASPPAADQSGCALLQLRVGGASPQAPPQQVVTTEKGLCPFEDDVIHRLVPEPPPESFAQARQPHPISESRPASADGPAQPMVQCSGLPGASDPECEFKPESLRIWLQTCHGCKFRVRTSCRLRISL